MEDNAIGPGRYDEARGRRFLSGSPNPELSGETNSTDDTWTQGLPSVTGGILSLTYPRSVTVARWSPKPKAGVRLLAGVLDFH